ncbi:aromatic ring-hydroxylating dioxygenase subunit alpha [Sphingomonas naphthae]|uniref:Aromatic ring-hydroxylating dioxygenase subunit alpha n=1 Tax=Sphingomonas naphthae TaxID=1813468 RepID=A0ABY7TG17_9SPHN|nr:aromatic ring-hydroxylating dioxygenase subunit alpha [Sphingomonas naphthae]WCT72168.1 aromatic ring-hydroxylating dioxygenase subunit alpha [Sphingomonas naphthae]
MAEADPLLPRDAPIVREDVTRSTFRVDRRAFVDPAILKRERDHIFSTCWLYLGHASELKRPNDFLIRSVGGRELVFNRDRKGAVHAFFNVCPHRGAQVVRESSGNAMSFRCFYHGWSFNNNGQFASRFDAETYPADFNAEGCANLRSVPRLDSYRDLWFVNFSAEGESLSDYLAGAKEIIDLAVDHSEIGMEVVGGTQEYSIRANWKLLAENSNDGYHASETHSTYIDYLGVSTGYGAQALRNAKPTLSRGIDLGNGHAVIEYAAAWGRPVAQSIPTWGEHGKAVIDAKRARLEELYGPDRARRIARGNRNMVIFPNLVINDIMALTVRTFYPEQVDELHVTGWALAPVDEDPQFRAWRLDNFLEFLGPGGFATPDDVEALESAQKGYRNLAEVPFNDLSRGMARAEKLHDDEEQMRAFWREWSRRVEGVA